MGALRRFEPGIEAGAGPPGGLDHRGQSPVAPSHEVLHGREAGIGHVDLDPPQPSQGAAQQLLAAPEFGGAHAVPLERCVRLGGEVADGEIEVLTALVKDGMGSAFKLSVPLDVNIGIGTSWDLAAH